MCLGPFQEELFDFKKKINQQIRLSGIQIYQFPDEALITPDETEKKEDVKVCNSFIN